MLGLMSYSITVRAVDGQLTVEHSGDVPDGTHIISGHEDHQGRSVGITRNHPEGHQQVTASGYHSKEH